MALPAYIDATTGAITDGEAWVAIATTTLGSDTATVTFTSPDDGSSTDWSQFMDLVLVSYARATGAVTDTELAFRFNNDTGSNYLYQKFRGDGSSVTSSTAPYSFVMGGRITGASAGANIFGATISHLFDINSGKYKSGLFQAAADQDGAGWAVINAVTWQSQAAITEIDIFAESGLLKDESRFDLFGVLPRMVA